MSATSLLHREVHRNQSSLPNRIKSIVHDATYVTHLRQDVYPQLLFYANLRQGPWYFLNPSSSSASSEQQQQQPQPQQHWQDCYFKSADGHMGCVQFSLTRLNLSVALSAAQQGAVVVVDATRKGKRWPDSLSMTIPLWCCVWNRAVALLRRRKSNDNTNNFTSSSSSSSCSEQQQQQQQQTKKNKEEEDVHSWDTRLYIPPWRHSDQEVARIEAKIDAFVALLMKQALPAVQQLEQHLVKPLRPMWVHREGEYTIPQQQLQQLDYSIVLCASVSLCEQTTALAHRQGYHYLQGAADDEEAWNGKGALTHQLLRQNLDELLLLDNAEAIFQYCKRQQDKEEEEKNRRRIDGRKRRDDMKVQQQQQQLEISNNDDHTEEKTHTEQCVFINKGPHLRILPLPQQRQPEAFLSLSDLLTLASSSSSFSRQKRGVIFVSEEMDGKQECIDIQTELEQHENKNNSMRESVFVLWLPDDKRHKHILVEQLPRLQEFIVDKENVVLIIRGMSACQVAVCAVVLMLKQKERKQTKEQQSTTATTQLNKQIIQKELFALAFELTQIHNNNNNNHSRTGVTPPSRRLFKEMSKYFLNYNVK